jgi:rhodanese-related sulfurtransferase
MASNMKNIALYILLLTLFGCSDYALETGPHFDELSVTKAKQMIENNKGNPKFILLDVRTESEVATGYIENAVMIDFRDPKFAHKIKHLDLYARILVYCGSGIRSGHTCDLLRQSGFKEGYNMLGGIKAWKAAEYPLIK